MKRRIKEKSLERKYISEARKKIKKKAIAAGLREKEKQTIKYYQEREKINTQRRLKALRQPQTRVGLLGMPIQQQVKKKVIKTSKPSKKSKATKAVKKKVKHSKIKIKSIKPRSNYYDFLKTI